MRFTAPVITGAGRGRKMNVPTLNLDLSHIPKDLAHGIYACWILIGEKKLQGAVHFGPRPVFKADTAFEIHVLDETLDKTPAAVTVEIVSRIRDIKDFKNSDELVKQISHDIEETRAILNR